MLIMCILTSVGQVLVKKGINIRKERGMNSLSFLYFLQPHILSGIFFVLISPPIYIHVVRLSGLSAAYGLNGLSYIIVYALGSLFLKEKGSMLHTAGLIFISTGVFIWSI